MINDISFSTTYSSPSPYSSLVPTKELATQVNLSGVVNGNWVTFNITTNPALPQKTITIVNTTPDIRIVEPYYTVTTDNNGIASLTVALTNGNGYQASSCLIQAYSDNLGSNTISINYTPGLQYDVISNSSDSIFNTLNSFSIDQVINTIKGILNRLSFDGNDTYEKSGALDPRIQSFFNEVTESINDAVAARKLTFDTIASWYDNVYSKVHLNPLVLSEHTVAMTLLASRIAADPISVMKSSPSVDIALAMERYAEVGAWVSKVFKAVLDSSTVDKGSGNDTVNTHANLTVKADKYYLATNSTAHIDVPSLITSCKTILLQANGLNIHTDALQASCGTVWMRAENLMSLISTSTYRHNAASLLEISNKAEYVSAGMTIYGDTTYIQAGQMSHVPLNPIRTDPLIAPIYGNLYLNATTSNFRKANVGDYCASSIYAVDAGIIFINSGVALSAIARQQGMIPRTYTPVIDPPGHAKTKVTNPTTQATQYGNTTANPPLLPVLTKKPKPISSQAMFNRSN